MSSSKIVFRGRGHPNVQATHLSTLEFTKDKHLTLRGDCIIAVDCDFSPEDIMKAAQWDHIRTTVTAGSRSYEVISRTNPGFSDHEEIVIRRSGFISDRTLGIHSDKACIDMDREMVKELKNPDGVVEITISRVDE